MINTKRCRNIVSSFMFYLVIVYLLTLEEEKFMITIDLWKWLIRKIIKPTFSAPYISSDTVFLHSIQKELCFKDVSERSFIGNFNLPSLRLSTQSSERKIVSNYFVLSSRCFILASHSKSETSTFLLLWIMQWLEICFN